MRCKKEEFVKGRFFHFYNHSVPELKLFREHEDYIYFLKKFKKNLEKYPLTVIAYCLPRVIKYLITYVCNYKQNNLYFSGIYQNIVSITRGEMPNHYHFFLRQDSDIPIYNIFDDSFASYSITNKIFVFLGKKLNSKLQAPNNK
ncbi:MAG: hypothetical protein ISS28_04325 [Candidatus Cloacimonetes bacterium]|nr:hypothetical protein [Candidatus Cloacimonadota bacterium]MBL7086307.1 hypothetical protein [Candidatus Cloacimonadota bacterium]